jgi:hypothetical protein
MVAQTQLVQLQQMEQTFLVVAEAVVAQMLVLEESAALV